MRNFNFIVNDEYNDKTVEQFLKGYVNLSARVIRSIKFQEDNMLKNNQKIRTVDLIKKGDCISFYLDEDIAQITPLYNCNAKFIYFDEDVIVADKPSNMPTHRAKYHQDETLENAYAGFLKNRNEKCSGFKAVYRLDKDTTGVVVIARHSFSADFISKHIQKTYYAVCSGVFDNIKGVINAPIGRESEQSHKRIVVENGKKAITEYEVIEQKDDCALVKFNLKTGRTHQIRVHMNYIGHPLLGDEIYANSDLCLKIKRQALHCGQCSFIHPVTKETLAFKSQLSDDIRALGFDYII